MTVDSPLGQVVSLSAKRLLKDIPRPDQGDAVLRDVVGGMPFDGAVTGFVLACLAGKKGTVLWASDRMSRRENGRLYGPALRRFGFLGRILRVEVSHPRDVLWAMEEGASCAGLIGVVGEIHGAPEVLSFTASKRLALRAEASGVPVWLIRTGEDGALSAARERWRLSAMASERHPYNPQAPGAPAWEAELFRARGRAPGTWRAIYEPERHANAGAKTRTQDRLRLVSRSGDGPLAADHHAAADAAG
ncbi:MAG: hypothetical protein AAF744_06130 [Pseudomonadota bacterium]